MEKEFIIAEVFAVKGHGNMATEKIGTAKFSLKEVLEENSDDHPKS